MNGATAVKGDNALMMVIDCRIAVTRKMTFAGRINWMARAFGRKFHAVYLVVLISLCL